MREREGDPRGEGLPLIELFKLLIDAPGKAKVGAILLLGPALLSLLSLLVWLPAPGGAGAKLYAYFWIFWGALTLLTSLIVVGHLGDVVGSRPFVLVEWVAGASTEAFSVAGAAYLILAGYGLATVLGKKLE